LVGNAHNSGEDWSQNISGCEGEALSVYMQKLGGMEMMSLLGTKEAKWFTDPADIQFFPSQNVTLCKISLCRKDVIFSLFYGWR
jgi:hypothetical protein